MRSTTVLISGASIAGPSLAYWLGRFGFTPTVVELAPTLRGGGYAVDFREGAHMSILAKMGVLDDLKQVQTGGSPMQFLDETGAPVFRLPGDFAGGDLEVSRSDLSRVLYEHSKDSTEYIFGDSIAALRQTPHGVHVDFERGGSRSFDLVVGADGLHSNVRRLAFGPENRYVTFLKYYLAGWELPNTLDLGPDNQLYNVPGRLVSVAGDRRNPASAIALLAFSSPKLDYGRRDLAQQKDIINRRFGDLGWHTPRLLDSLGDTTELYFDSISRVDVPSWSTGRVALLGDAGYGATLGGMGTGTAVIAAYVLAGELAAGTDHRDAFASYEGQLRSFVKRCQSGGSTAGGFLAPSSRLRLWARNRTMRNSVMMSMMLKESRKRSSNIALKDYPG